MNNDTIIITDFARDTLKGLRSEHKYLLPRYFYDDNGSKLFRRIMNMPEYYLSDSEMEIFREQSIQIIKSLNPGLKGIDIIELGSGDGTKTEHLLKTLDEKEYYYRYIPVDISQHAIDMLSEKVRSAIPGINIEAKTGDYFEVMQDMKEQRDKAMLILFLGSSIGNFQTEQLHSFLDELSSITMAGDKIMIGFDLKKDKDIIMKAYNDPYGLTRDFNLNHLLRINRELEADFNTEMFEHIQEYNSATGEMKSYLISKDSQELSLGLLNEKLHFRRGERIFMELSRKFSRNEVKSLAESHGFRIINEFTDKRNYFLDTLWIKE